MKVDVAGKTVATLKFREPRGREAVGSYRIEFDLDVSYDVDQILFLALAAELQVKSGGHDSPVCALHRSEEGWRVGTDVPTRDVVGFHAYLSRTQMEELERIRNGGDVRLYIQLYGIVSGAGAGNAPTHFRGGQYFVVHQGEWVRLLEAMGYQKTLLLEVPVPDEDDAPDLAEAIRHLAEAQRLLAEGRSRGSIGECRDVMEALSLETGDGDKTDPEVDRLFANTRAMDLPGRLRVLRRAMKLVMHTARHVDELTAHIDWSRDDAVALLAMTAALVRWRQAGLRR